MASTKIHGARQIADTTITNTQISASAAIALSKLAVMPIATDGSSTVAADIPMSAFKITGMGDPLSAQDAATKKYVDSVAQGLSPKNSARAATTGALAANTYANGASGVGATLTANGNGALAAQDVITLVANDRLLVKNEVTTSHNGIYVVTQVGDGSHPYILTRAVDMDAPTEVDGAFMFIEEGTALADTQWVCTTTGAVTIGTTGITFSQFFSASAITAGNGLSKSGNTLSALDDATGGGNLSRSVNVSGNGLAVKIDDATIGENGSSQLAVKTSGIGTTQIANNAVTKDKIPTTVVGAGTGLTGGGGSQISINRVTRETPTGAINGSNTAFVLASTPMTGTEEVFLNGILQEAGAGNDYTISAATITMLTAPVSGDRIKVSYFI